LTIDGDRGAIVIKAQLYIHTIMTVIMAVKREFCRVAQAGKRMYTSVVTESAKVLLSIDGLIDE